MGQSIGEELETAQVNENTHNTGRDTQRHQHNDRSHHEGHGPEVQEQIESNH